MQKQTLHAVAREGSHVGVDDPVLHAVCSSAVTSKTYSTIYTKLQLQRYTSAFKLKSNCNLPAVFQHCTSPCKNTIFVCRPYLHILSHFLTNLTNAQKSSLNSTSPDISVEKVIKHLDSFDGRMNLYTFKCKGWPHRSFED